MSAPEPAGSDLARIALQAARAAAKTRPAGPAPKPRRRSTARRMDGRDPLPLGKALENLVAEHGWETPAAGGTVIDQWPAIAPELAGKVAAEGFDAETGCLSLRPATAAYGAQMRLFARQMVARIAEKTGTSAVRSLRILPPRGPAGTTPDVAAASDGPVAAPGAGDGIPLKTRADASPGLLAAQELLATLRAGAEQEAARTTPPPVLREPESAFADAVAMTEDTAARATRAEDPRERALARARAEKADQAPAVPRAFARTA